MINIEELKDWYDVGREVIYVSQEDPSFRDIGRIHHWSEKYVYVVFYDSNGIINLDTKLLYKEYKSVPVPPENLVFADSYPSYADYKELLASKEKPKPERKIRLNL